MRAWKRKKAAKEAEEANRRSTEQKISPAEQVGRLEAIKTRMRPRRSKRVKNDENMIAIFRRLATERMKVRLDGRQRTMTLAKAIIRKTAMRLLTAQRR